MIGSVTTIVNQINDEFTNLPITNQKRYRLRHPNQDKEYRNKNKDKINRYSRKWFKINRRHVLGKQRERRRKIRKEAIVILGAKCVNPYNINHGDFLIDERCLTIDHIKNGGNKDRRKFCSVENYYEFIIEEVKKGSKDYQCLCSNCNHIKEMERREEE